MIVMTPLFDNRIEVAELLASAIKEYSMQTKKDSFSDQKMIVLAIPRGGVILGDIRARKYDCNLDIVISKKIGAPHNKELAIGAVMPRGTYFINEHFIQILDVSQKYIQNEVQLQLKEIQRRLIEFRRSDTNDTELEGKIVVLVDDGIATRATIVAAAQWIVDEKYRCKKLVIAVPVAPGRDETINKLNQIADKVIILYSPIEFSAVGLFYSKFDQVTDEEVKAIMKKYEKLSYRLN